MLTKLLLTTVVILGLYGCTSIQDRIKNIQQNQVQPSVSASENEYYSKGINQYLAGNYKDAINSFKKAIEVSPNQAKYYRNLGEALKSDGQIKEAIAQMNTAKKLYQQQGDTNAASQIDDQLKSWNVN
jgi:tetratricopeptide (TPR) repeat protein